MPVLEFTENHVRPGVFYWSPEAYKERQEVKARRQDAAAHYKRAKVHLTTSTNSAAAEQELALALAAWPDNTTILGALADCIAHQRGDPERALPYYDALLDAADSPAHRMARGRALAALGWLDQAMTDMDAAVAAHPLAGQYLRERGLVRQRMGQPFDAMLDYTAALPLLRERGSPVADTLFNRGFCNRLLGNNEEAMADMQAAMQLAPGCTAVKMTLGCMYVTKRQYKDALDMFEVAMAYKPCSAAAANNVALAQYLLATAEQEAPNKHGRPGKRQPAGASAPLQGRSALPAGGNDGADSEDELSDADDETADADAMLEHQGRANENPRQWALNVVQGWMHRAVGDDPWQRGLLESSLRNFNAAAALYMDDAARMKAQAPSDGEVHALHENEAGPAADGYLIILTNKVRVPGSPVIHDREIEDGEIQYNRGLVHLVLGQLAEAEANFQDALAGNPSHAHYPHYRAVVHGRKNELKDAVKCNQSALNLNPAYFPALYHQGLCLYLQSRNAEAIQRLDAALGLQPKNWQVMEARGRVLQELDRHPEALLSLQDAIRYCDADEPPASLARLHFAVAQSAITTHAPDLLRSSLRDARLNGQDPASVHALRGLLAHREGRHRKALAYLGRAIRLAPQEARFLYDRSQVYLDLHDAAAAVADMSAALQRLPDAASLHYSRGMVMFTLEDDEQALKDLEAAAALMAGAPAPMTPSRGSSPASGPTNSRGPTPSRPESPLSARLSRLGSVGRAVPGAPAPDIPRWALPDALVPAGPMPPRGSPTATSRTGGGGETGRRAGNRAAVVYETMAPVGVERGKLRPDQRLWEGTKFLTNASSPPDWTVSLWYHLGLCRARRGAWPAAAAALELAAGLLPTHPAVVHELAKAFQAMGDHAAAVSQYNKVLALQPGNAVALLRRGIAHAALRDFDAAARDLEGAKAMDPTNPTLRVDYRALHLVNAADFLGKPGQEAAVWDLQAFPPGALLPR